MIKRMLFNCDDKSFVCCVFFRELCGFLYIGAYGKSFVCCAFLFDKCITWKIVMTLSLVFNKVTKIFHAYLFYLISSSH